MGPYPMPYGSQGRTTRTDIQEMVNATPGTDLVIIPDMVEPDSNSFDKMWAFNQMRNSAIQIGFDYRHLLLIENDVRVRTDTLSTLLAHDQSITIPYLCYVSHLRMLKSCYGPELGDPSIPPANGSLHILDWAAHSVILFQMSSVVKIPVVFAGGQEGADHKRWQKFVGPAMMAVDAHVDILRVPSDYKEESKQQEIPANYE